MTRSRWPAGSNGSRRAEDSPTVGSERTRSSSTRVTMPSSEWNPGSTTRGTSDGATDGVGSPKRWSFRAVPTGRLRDARALRRDGDGHDGLIVVLAAGEDQATDERKRRRGDRRGPEQALRLDATASGQDDEWSLLAGGAGSGLDALCKVGARRAGRPSLECGVDLGVGQGCGVIARPPARAREPDAQRATATWRCRRGSRGQRDL